MIEFPVICRGCVAFVALFGFLFGQLFSGQFETLATVIGISGLGLAALGLGKRQLSTTLAMVILLLGGVTLTGVGIDVFDYYDRTPSYSGTYYPWILVGPYIVAVLIILGHAASQLRRAG